MKKLFLILIISALAACSVPKVSAAYAKFDFGADYSVAGRNTADGSYIVSAINVKDFGAAGDGVTDDTSAFEEAFEAVILGPRGGVLFIPAGEYRVTRPGFRLTAGVAVTGVGNRKSETGGETLIIADFPNDSTKPLFEMTSNTSIMNLSVYYKRQNINDVTTYPYTISTEENYACFVTIRNITLYNSFKGVNTVGGAQHVANVSGTVLDTGIEVGGNAEVSEYMNCRFDSSFWAGKDGTDRAKIAAYTVDRAAGMKIGYVDDIFIYNVNFPKTEFSEGVYFYLNGASRAAGASGIAYGFVYKAEDTEVSFSDDYDGYVAGWPHITVLDEIKGASAYEFYEPSERYSTKSDLFNVRAYGAKGNGSADDTEAFLKALEAARKNGGGIVFVPSGKYSVSSRLEVPQNTEILGEWYGYRTGSPSQINVRYQGGGNDYFIGLSAGSGVQGITFYLPDNKPESYAAPTGDSYGYANGSAYDPTADVFPTEALGIAPRPYLIRGRGDSVWAENICITNGYNGIDLKSERCDDFVVRGVWGTCMNSGIEVGGGSENGQISCVFFTFGTWWESIARRIDLSCYTYENAKGFTFGNCRNIMALSASTFGLCECLRFVKEGDGEPENISVARALMDTPYGHVCLKIDAGDDLSFVGVSSGTHPTEANGRISSAVTVGENFAGKARVYGQNIWAGCENVLRGDTVVYTGGETSAETISHNFSFGNYLTEFTFGEDSGADVAKTSSPAEKTGCGGTLDAAAFIWVATVLSVCVIKKQKKEKQYEEKY